VVHPDGDDVQARDRPLSEHRIDDDELLVTNPLPDDLDDRGVQIVAARTPLREGRRVDQLVGAPARLYGAVAR
jgi:hypothetical protein